ncbi:MAG: mercury methylation ferredoxin HgcB [Solirubrobacterales bacterium]
MRKHRYLSNVSTLKLVPEQCTGCGFCLDVCPHEVLALADRTVIIRDADACMECGACAKNCPFGAIVVEAGVGCASAILRGVLTGGPPSCGCAATGCGAPSGCSTPITDGQQNE